MFFFFFFEQKTAYEMLRSLVGSEMCIRDSVRTVRREGERDMTDLGAGAAPAGPQVGNG